jgi:hypothetical protein
MATFAKSWRRSSTGTVHVAALDKTRLAGLCALGQPEIRICVERPRQPRKTLRPPQG